MAKKSKRLLLINPDRKARQIFPPFKFLLEALVARDFDVLCLSKVHLSLSNEADNFEVLPQKRVRSFVPSLHFLVLSLIEVFSQCFFKKCEAIVVFRCADVVWHKLSGALTGTKIVFFVDYVPWSHLGPIDLRWTYVFLQPRLFFRILGFYSANKVIFSSQSLSDQICENLPFIKSKSVVVKYSTDIFENVEVEESKVSIAKRFNSVDRPFVIASTAGYHSDNAIEICLRAMVATEDPSFVLLLHTDHPDINYFYSLITGLGLSDRVEIYGAEENFFNLMASANVIVLPTAGAGTGGFALSALGRGIPVLGVDTSDLREWLFEEELLYDAGNTQDLASALLAIKKKDKGVFEAFARAKARASELGSDWHGRAISAILE